MNIVRKKEALLLFVGDMSILLISLYMAITLRIGAIPSGKLFMDHLIPFSFLFLVSIFVSFIAGLYEKHTLSLKSKLPKILTRVQIINAVISVAFFYFIPYLTITPKIVLFIYLLISFIIMIAWRMMIIQTFGGPRKHKAILIGQGNEIRELFDEINHNPRYGTVFVSWIDTSISPVKNEEIRDIIKSHGVSLVFVDFNEPKISEVMSTLYNLIFSGVRFVDTQKMYEEVFDRVPLSLVNDVWFLENVSSSAKKTSFDIFKRLMDIVVSGFVGLISLLVYPFVYISIKLDDGGVLFSYQDRVGEGNKIARIIKFRTMSVANDGAKWSKGNKSTNNAITRVGSFLRKSRIDELPQLWNVFMGDISLIGPRPEFADAVAVYSSKIPYYNVRHIIKPGLSGWAQIYGKHPHHGINTEETSNKLSYDLFYIKNRSILLDIKIALKTLKVLVSFVGR